MGTRERSITGSDHEAGGGRESTKNSDRIRTWVQDYIVLKRGFVVFCMRKSDSESEARNLENRAKEIKLQLFVLVD